MRTAQILIALIAAIVCACFSASCNALDGLRQFTNSTKPVPFSSSWWYRREEAAKAREFKAFQREWGVTPTCLEGEPALTFTLP